MVANDLLYGKRRKVINDGNSTCFPNSSQQAHRQISASTRVNWASTGANIIRECFYVPASGVRVLVRNKQPWAFSKWVYV